MVKNIIMFILLLPIVIAGWAISITVTGALLSWMAFMSIIALPFFAIHKLGNWLVAKGWVSPPKSASPSAAPSPPAIP